VGFNRVSNIIVLRRNVGGSGETSELMGPTRKGQTYIHYEKCQSKTQFHLAGKRGCC